MAGAEAVQQKTNKNLQVFLLQLFLKQSTCGHAHPALTQGLKKQAAGETAVI